MAGGTEGGLVREGQKDRGRECEEGRDGGRDCQGEALGEGLSGRGLFV